MVNGGIRGYVLASSELVLEVEIGLVLILFEEPGDAFP